MWRAKLASSINFVYGAQVRGGGGMHTKVESDHADGASVVLKMEVVSW